MRRGRLPALLTGRGWMARVLHTVLHSAASALIASGTHIKVVQELLGHSTNAMTLDAYAISLQCCSARRLSGLGEAFPW